MNLYLPWLGISFAESVWLFWLSLGKSGITLHLQLKFSFEEYVAFVISSMYEWNFLRDFSHIVSSSFHNDSLTSEDSSSNHFCQWECNVLLPHYSCAWAKAITFPNIPHCLATFFESHWGNASMKIWITCWYSKGHAPGYFVRMCFLKLLSSLHSSKSARSGSSWWKRHDY